MYILKLIQRYLLLVVNYTILMFPFENTTQNALDSETANKYIQIKDYPSLL